MKKENKNVIIERIEKQTGIPDLANILIDKIKPTDLQSLLLAVFREKVLKRTPSEILEDYSSNNYLIPSRIDPKHLLEWDQLAFSNLPQEFRSLELSPIAPFGSVSRLAPINQDWILTTIRNTEILSDSSNVLALECALQRKEQIKSKKVMDSVHLAASHRVVRTQKYDNKDLIQHFRIFSLCSAGRDKGNLHFELETIKTHIHFYLDTIKKFLGKKISLIVTILDLFDNSHINQILSDFSKELQEQLNKVEVRFKIVIDKEKDYYQNIRFKIHGKLEENKEIEFVDGGITDWTQKLLNNAKERLIISGLGTERICKIASKTH